MVKRFWSLLIRHHNTAIRLALPLAVILLFVVRKDRSDFFSFANCGVASLALAVAAYAFSQMLRAMRFVVLAASIVPLKLRVLLSLHFHAAIVSLAAPYKLGELYRWRELSVLTGDTGRSLLVVLIERMFDAMVLILLCAVLATTEGELPPYLRNAVFVLGSVLGIVFFIFCIVGPCLEPAHKYIFIHYASFPARVVLRFIDSLRQAIAVSQSCLKGKFSLLLSLSALIWAAEVVAAVALAPAMYGRLGEFVIDNVLLALLPGQGNKGDVPYLLATWFLFLTLLWFPATFFYLRYAALPFRRSPPSSKAAPLADQHQPRRIKLHTPRRTPCRTN